MSQNLFLTALQKVASASLTLGELIRTAGVLQDQGHANLAQQLYRIWIRSNSDSEQLHFALFNSSVLDAQLGETDAAIASLEAAIARKPDFQPPYINLGRQLEQKGDTERALALWRTVVAQPGPVTGDAINYVTAALTQIARVLGDRQDPAGSEQAVQEALSVNPNQPELIAQLIGMRLGTCQWPIMAEFNGLDRKRLMAGTHPLSMTWLTDDPLLHLASAERYVRLAVDAKIAFPDTDRRHAPIDLENRRLRIGYVSSDLRDHAIGYLMAELFEMHDKSKVEIFAYYCGIETTSVLADRIKAAVEHWTDIRKMTDEEAAKVIAADGIDILVDINGHTRDGRTGLFALRPAPIAVNWLGYPGSMASAYHHYIIADDWIVPQESEIYYAEKVLRLPCYQPNDRKRKVAETRPGRADVGLPNDAVVFCCFNGTQKFSKPCVLRWFDILKRVPGSVLWLLESTALTVQRLLDFAEQNGIARERLIFAPKQQNAYHLARYPLADLFLDTSPYGAHTTASDALWMGVPVLTLSGRSFASRVCGSLVRSAGIGELVCASTEDYVERAVELGNNPAAIKTYKERLEAGRDSCVLFDTARLAARLEDLYRIMCVEYRQGRLPRPDLTNLEAYLSAGILHDADASEMSALADYHGFYKHKLRKLHLARPLHPDARLWPASDIAAADVPPGAESSAPQTDRGIANAVERLNQHLAAGEFAQAESYAAGLAVLEPANKMAQNLALTCNLKLGRQDESVKYARSLLALEPNHLAARTILADHCKAAGDVAAEIEHRAALALLERPGVQPLIRLRDLHDAASLILCHGLNLRGIALVRQLLAGAASLAVNAPPGSEWQGWEKHYRVLLDAVDIASLLAPTPQPAIDADADTKFVTASGAPLDWAGVQAAAEKAGAQAVFFAAADKAYVELYARWYARSILKFTDVPSLVIIHVIGGAKELKRIAQAVDINDPRLVFAGDAFDAAAVTTKCYDAPPKGLAAKPLAHLQSARFLRAGALLRHLLRPVFVSDIDLLLQRGVSDLLQSSAGTDLVLNENSISFNAGSRLTANLLLLRPTPNTMLFLAYLKDYLERMLGRAEISRWIDQLGLIMALHHLRIHVPGAGVAFFDTERDINNVMYRSYQPHPFRFLSLYHGFDLASLEGSLETPAQQSAPSASRPATRRKRKVA